MRWGVRDEATDDHMTTELCMKEIENCQRLSMGPNFVVKIKTHFQILVQCFKLLILQCISFRFNLYRMIDYRAINLNDFLFSFCVMQVFLGQKYGYRPIPTYIISSELELLREELVNVGSDVTLLDTWYRKDSNAVPPISVLQPISSILINFNNKVGITQATCFVLLSDNQYFNFQRIPKLQQQDQAIWWDTLAKMQKLFRKASISLFNSGKIDKDTMHNYYMSGRCKNNNNIT